MEQSLLFMDFIKMQIEEAGPMTIQEHYPQARLATHQLGEFFQMEAAVDEQMTLGQEWRQIDLAPYVLGATSENRFGPRPGSLPFLRQFKDALEIASDVAVPTVLFRFAKRLAHKVFGLDGFFPM